MQGILNHATLVSQLSQALAKIGEALQQTKLCAELYQTDNMREAIARLYAHILLFFQQAVRWYTMGPAGRAFSSIFKPFDLDYKDTVEQIRLCSQTINDIASASSRAEIRDIHITIQMQNRQLQERDNKLHEMQLQLKEIQSKIDSSTGQVLQVATSKPPINIVPRPQTKVVCQLLVLSKPSRICWATLPKALIEQYALLEIPKPYQV